MDINISIFENHILIQGSEIINDGIAEIRDTIKPEETYAGYTYDELRGFGNGRHILESRAE